MTEAIIYCPANQWTDFYMITASVMKGLMAQLCELVRSGAVNQFTYMSKSRLTYFKVLFI